MHTYKWFNDPKYPEFITTDLGKEFQCMSLCKLKQRLQVPITELDSRPTNALTTDHISHIMSQFNQQQPTNLLTTDHISHIASQLNQQQPTNLLTTDHISHIVSQLNQKQPTNLLTTDHISYIVGQLNKKQPTNLLTTDHISHIVSQLNQQQQPTNLLTIDHIPRLASDLKELIYGQSRNRGLIGEEFVKQELACNPAILVTECGGIRRNGDFVVSIDGIDIMIEVKSYKCTIPTPEVNKFYRDLDSRGYQYGILLSLDSAIVSCKNIFTKINKEMITGSKKVLLVSHARLSSRCLIAVIIMSELAKFIKANSQDMDEDRIVEIITSIETDMANTSVILDSLIINTEKIISIANSNMIEIASMKTSRACVLGKLIKKFRK